jgi:hypothetical protein
MSDKVLVKADVTQFQTVGQGSPSMRDLFNAVRGRGTKRGSKVGIKGRAAGLAGLAGKGAAIAATALSTADAMQGGNIAAPLGAGYTYQGLDPTGKLTGEAIEGDEHYRRGRFWGGRRPHVDLPVPGMANNEGGKPLPLPPNTPQHIPLPATAAPAPATAAPAAPAATTVPLPTAPVAPAPATAAPPPQPTVPVPLPATAAPPPQPTVPVPLPATAAPPNVLNQPSMASTVQQQMNTLPPPNVLNQQDMASTVQHQMNPSGMPQYQPPIDPVTGQPRPMMKTKAFNGMLFDLLGPDYLYKMTPNEIGELAAYMYIKTR